MPETKQALLEHAAARFGVSFLAEHLNVPGSLLEAWLSGQAPIPDRKLLALVDLLEKLGDMAEKK